MSAVLHPVGSLPPQIYWRRRVAALVVGVVALSLVFWLASSVIGAIRGAVAGDDAQAQTNSGAVAEGQGANQDSGGQNVAAVATSEPTTSAAPESPPASVVAPPTSAPPTAPPACGAALTVTATADAEGYPLGATAQLGMTIVNSGDAPCTADAGSAALELVVTSGEDRIWSSDDCQPEQQTRPTTVVPGAEGALVSSVKWPLTRSTKDCTKELPALKPGTYQLTARSGELTSKPLAFKVTE